MLDEIAQLRRNYQQQVLDERDVAASPIVQFRVWFEEARQAQVDEPNAMTLATATREGLPSARVVLLKGVDEAQGFTFFTNYGSRKAVELEENPHAALVFCWLPLERQVRIMGVVCRTSEALSDAYFASRPSMSRLGAIASPQSRVISRAELESNFERLQAMYGGGEEGGDVLDVPRPDFWGGYCVKPTCVEFWQGRPNRMHDRIQYRLLVDGSWCVERLAP